MHPLSKEEFCKRFVAELMRITGGKDGEGSDVRPYAEEIAPTYFEDQFSDDPSLSPEQCAQDDFSYWED